MACTIKVYLLLVSILLLSGCIEVESQFSITSPSSDVSYVGYFDSPLPIDRGMDTLSENIVLTYDSAPESIDIYLNGYQIEEDFTFSETQATAAVSTIKEYLIQGENTISVNPLAFGPSMTFTAGPTIAAKHVCYEGEASCSLTNFQVQVKMELIDTSGIASISLQGEVAELNDGLYEVTVSEDDYSVTG